MSTLHNTNVRFCDNVYSLIKEWMIKGEREREGGEGKKERNKMWRNRV